MTERQAPVRMCVICRRRFAKPQLLRHVLAADGGTAGNGLEADVFAVKPGRGWYVCDDPQCRSRFAGMKFRRKSHKGSKNGKDESH